VGLFLNASGGAASVDSPPECQPPNDFWRNLLRDIIIGIISAICGKLPMIVVKLLHHRKFHHPGSIPCVHDSSAHWTESTTRRHIIWIRGLDAALITFLLLYSCFAVFFIMALLCNIPQSTQIPYITAFGSYLLQSFILFPFMTACVYLAWSNITLWVYPHVRDQSRNYFYVDYEEHLKSKELKEEGCRGDDVVQALKEEEDVKKKKAVQQKLMLCFQSTSQIVGCPPRSEQTATVSACTEPLSDVVVLMASPAASDFKIDSTVITGTGSGMLALAGTSDSASDDLQAAHDPDAKAKPQPPWQRHDKGRVDAEEPSSDNRKQNEVLQHQISGDEKVPQEENLETSATASALPLTEERHAVKEKPPASLWAFLWHTSEAETPIQQRSLESSIFGEDPMQTGKDNPPASLWHNSEAEAPIQPKSDSRESSIFVEDPMQTGKHNPPARLWHSSQVEAPTQLRSDSRPSSIFVEDPVAAEGSRSRTDGKLPFADLQAHATIKPSHVSIFVAGQVDAQK